MAIEVRWQAACEIGNYRETNEDAWGAWSFEEPAGAVLLAVADGMGGQPGGEVASRLAVDACTEEAASRGGSQSAAELLGDLFRVARERLEEEARRKPGLIEMGTTLTLLLLREDGAWVGHLGDTRLFWVRGRTIALVTTDHSVAWERVESGRLSPDEAERDPLGSLLTRHLGPHAPSEPDLFDRPLDLEAGDRLLLCSDGLGKVVSIPEIAGIVAGHPVERAVPLLVERALERGGPDNITILLAETATPVRPTGEVLPFDSFRYRFEAPA